MKIVAIEPLGLRDELVAKLFNEIVGEGHELILYRDRPSSEGEAIERVRDADVLITVSYPVTRRVIYRAERLKLIAVSFTGVDHVDLDAAREKGVRVANVPGYATESVAELVIGLVIAAARRIVDAHNTMRSGGWRDERHLGFEIRGKMFGIVGFGRIGRRVAELAHALGAHVVVYDRSPWKPEKRSLAEKIGAEFVTLDELFKRSNIVSIHVPLTRETRWMIRYEHLKLLPSDAIIVNVARGPIIKEDDLVRFLNERPDVIACLDVYDVEPLPPSHPLRRLPNVILTPHIGFYTREALYTRIVETFRNIRAFIDGKPRNLVV